MSAIASFYLVPKQKSGDLIAAAIAQDKALKKKKWGIFAPKLPLNPDPFWTFIKTQTKELEQFPYSGYLLLDVDLLAKGALSSKDDLGKQLAEITHSSFVAYQLADAQRAIGILNSVTFSDAKIKQLVEEDRRPSDYPEIVEPLKDSSRRLKAWLECVTDEQIGILNIG
jgi:hypothetical protein